MKKIYFIIAVLGIFIALSLSNAFQSAELRSLNIFRKDFVPNQDIVILAIDNNSLQKIGRWPWDRQVYAKLINQLGSKPRVVAFDINFFENQDNTNDQLFAKSLDNTQFPVILSSQIINVDWGLKQILRPLPELYDKTNVTLGHTNVPASIGGFSVFMPHNISESIPFDFAIAKAINVNVKESQEVQSLINFAGPAGSFPTYSIADVLENKIPDEELEDKIILIGATASDLHDLVSAPTNPPLMSGIEWHANVLDNLILQRDIKILPPIYSGILGLLLAVLFLFLFFKTKTKTSLKIYIAAVLAMLAISYIAWNAGYAFPYLFNLVFISAIFLMQSFYRWYQSEVEKRKIKRNFQNYFSPQIMDYVMAHPDALKLGGVRKEMTILFSDIRSFTTITENTDPEVLSVLLHEYFTEMTEEVLRTNGVIDKFIGDAIMAFWGAPIDQEDQADRAVDTAIGMLKRLKTLQEKWKKKGMPFVDIGVGINTGLATVGNMGSEKRFDYTVIGDSVNAASRLEGLNKEYGSHIIISEDTKNKLSKKYNLAPLGEVLVKGKTKKLQIFEVKE